LHEMGNAMGFAEDVGDDVAGMILTAGERRVPVAAASVADVHRSAGWPGGQGSDNAAGAHRSAAAPAIRWNTGAPAVDDTCADVPDWLDDFVNNLGRNENARNPNAGMRIKLGTGRS